MPRKIIIETDEMNEETKDGFKREFKDEFRRMHEHRPFRGEPFKRPNFNMAIEKEVKLFTDKTVMVEYVNSLTNIHDVEIYKIEDDLYKVLVTRRKKENLQEEKE
ncbi:MAG: hypothetical protein KKH01_01375 [Firmicutes bacterium]|nr:hypothetical protein [Bacillota bacterium]